MNDLISFKDNKQLTGFSLQIEFVFSYFYLNASFFFLEIKDAKFFSLN